MANASAALIKSAAPASANRLDRLSDLISPLVVKEVRQMVRGREFNISFGISVLAGLIIAFVSIIYYSSGKSIDSGMGIFATLMTCLTILGVIVSPLGAFSALRNERIERTLDLVTITAMSPRRIVIGKLAAQAVKLTSLFAALAPFVAMSFLLGGIDFVTIAVSLASLFMWSLWACAAALFLSSLSKSRAVSAFIFGGMIFFFVIVFFTGGMGLISVIVRPMVGGRGGSMFFGSPFSGGSGDQWWVLIAATSFCVISGMNLVLLAENRLLLPTENRSTPLRIGFLIQFLFVIAFWLYPFLAVKGGFSASDAVIALCIFCGLHLAVIASFSVTEDISLSRRVIHQLRTAPLWRRLWMFRPGGSGGAVYVLMLMAILLAVSAIFIHVKNYDFTLLAALCGYVCFFTGVPTLAVRRWAPPRITTVHLRIGILVVLLVAALLPDFLVFLATGRYGGTYSARHIIDPFRTLIDWKEAPVKYIHVYSAIPGLIGLVSYLMLILLGRKRMRNDASN